MKLINKINPFLRFCFLSSITQLAHLVKVSYILGTFSGFFTLSSLIIPVGAATFGPSAALGASALAWFVHVIATKSLLLAFTYQLPTLCATYSFSGPRWLFYGAIPAICIAFFLMSPASAGGRLYAIYWFIPMVIGLLNLKNLFLRSLSATFIAHAVGSVLWLYAGKLSGGAWLALMPVVAIERLVFAGLMTGAILFFAWAKKIMQEPVQTAQRSHQGF